MQTEIVLSAPERLRLARLRAGLDQAELGALIGVHRAVVSQYENGHTEPTLSALVKWADVADVSLDWLCARRDSNPQPSDLYLAGSMWPCSHCGQRFGRRGDRDAHQARCVDITDDALDVEYQLLLLVEAVRS